MDESQRSFLCLDYGKKRVGVAVAMPPLYVVLPLGNIETKRSMEDTAKEVLSLVEARNITCVVIGNPLHLKGGDSLGSNEVALFRDVLEKVLGFSPILWDERLSSAEADRMLREKEMNRKQRAKQVDSVAASLILSSFLASNGYSVY
ncbi:Holliday junction resolvase RuvX [Chlamydiifrater phoenicopteri]|uniref:Holliday junction resolvase RuvX n=1 Tax=Chlamydiifrater phoenicopteri TaxID=2681469 RepID=UPI001BD13736|nr:Holliday junction resolvase RuvX [Chlamydiifrater phoenicopteri]